MSKQNTTNAVAKTNALRLLEAAGVPFTTRAYDVDESDLSAESVAAKLGLEESAVFKTLVCRGSRTGICFAVLPAGTSLDLKALARARDDKSIAVVALKEVLELTGYVRGGVSAIGAKKDYPVVVDESVILHDVISVSAGARGLQMVLAPDAYVEVTKAKVAAICTGH